MMKKMTISLCLMLLALAGKAQSADFCEAVTAVMNDAPNDFKNISGRMMDMNQNATMWASTIKIPGCIGYRIVKSMGLFYEGAMVQTTNKDDLAPAYDALKKKLIACLEPMGYKMSMQDNFVAGLSDLKKLVFMKPVKEDTPKNELPSHVTVETMYSKEVGKFTMVMFVFKN